MTQWKPIEIPDEFLRDQPDMQELLSNNQIVTQFQRTAMDTPNSVEMLSFLVKEVVAKRAWARRFDAASLKMYDYTAKGFRAFITDPLPGGLATTIDVLRDLLDAEALALVEGLIYEGPGAPKGNTNAKKGPDPTPGDDPAGGQETNRSGRTVCSPPSFPDPLRGTTRQYALRRLKRAADGYVPPKPARTTRPRRPRKPCSTVSAPGRSPATVP